jgi:hypothetical protein
MAERSTIKPLGFKQPGDCRKMVLALLKPLLPGKTLEKTYVHAFIERRERRPAFQVTESFFISQALAEVLQNLYLETSELTTLCDEPCVEAWAAIQLQPFKKLTCKAISNPTQLL